MDTWTDFIYFILFLYTLYILSSLFIYFIYSASFIRDMFYSLYILYIFYSIFLYTLCILYIWFSLYLQSHVLVFSGEWRHCFPINFSSPTTDWIRSPAIKSISPMSLISEVSQFSHRTLYFPAIKDAGHRAPLVVFKIIRWHPPKLYGCTSIKIENFTLRRTNNTVSRATVATTTGPSLIGDRRTSYISKQR